MPGTYDFTLLLLSTGLILLQIHARLGEVLYINASSPDGAQLASKSIQHFCRSIELCDDYLRGFYGLALVCLGSRHQWRFLLSIVY